MTPPHPGKLGGAVAPLLPWLALDADGQACLRGAADAAEGVARLERQGRVTDALRLAAYALPKREAVWWACMAARATPPRALVPLEAEALQAAESWVRRADEAVRHRCMALAMESGCRGPEAWAAIAAFWSGRSIAPPGAAPVAPAAHLTGVAVTGALALAAVRGDPARAAARHERFLSALRDIAAGGAGRLSVEEPAWS
ncbi:DUF6931 family protein [Roseomonas sp. USHLN139]|uniref:DUF6931 family protein n=1 Tax=Roseomonas sp. USHLN139 TaxID=3081298 RepID=UPI003B01F452